MSNKNGQGKASLTRIQALHQGRQLVDLGLPPNDDAAQTQFGELWSILCDNHPEPDKVIRWPTVEVKNANGHWLATIRLPSLSMWGQCWIKSLVTLFAELEAALQGDQIVWQYNETRPPRLTTQAKLKK